MSHRVRAVFQKRPPLIIPSYDIPKAVLQERDEFLVGMGERTHFEFTTLGRDFACDFYVISIGFSDMWTFPLRKKSPLKPILDRASVAFQENGLADYISTKIARNRTFCDPRMHQPHKSDSDWAIVIGLLEIFGFAVFAATLVLLVEVILGKWQKRRAELSVLHGA